MKQFGNFVLDTANECLWTGSTQLALQPKPFAVLRFLVENPGRLITHDELLNALWPDTFVQPQVLRTYMLELRKLLGDEAASPRFIQTLPKRGYCFVASVKERTAPARTTAAVCTEQAGLLGRDTELAKLAGHLEAVRSSQRQMIFLCGEAGIGKTAVLDALAREASPSSIVGRGQCVPGAGKDEDFYPVMEMLGYLCASADREVVCRVLARVAPAWLAATGCESFHGAALTAAPPERMPGSLCAALEEISSAKPLLLVIEDLQWADGATLKWLAALARRRAPARLMIVATYRPRSVPPDHPLKALRQELRLQRLVEEMVLAPLAKPVILKLLCREMGGGELSERVRAFVHEHAEGNPGFAVAVLRHLVAQKLLRRREEDGKEQWTAIADFEENAGVPDELAQMVELEMERLSACDQRLLEAASLMPVAFPAWAVAAALEEDPCEVEEACEALARRCYFVQRVGSEELPDGSTTGFYAFTHGFYREVLYLRQAATRRARRHVRVAEKLGQLFAGRESHVAREMAMHYEAAGTWRLGVQALELAARYAAERGSHAEAHDLLERALHIAGDRSEAREKTGEIHKALATARTIGVRAPAGKQA